MKLYQTQQELIGLCGRGLCYQVTEVRYFCGPSGFPLGNGVYSPSFLLACSRVFSAGASLVQHGRTLFSGPLDTSVVQKPATNSSDIWLARSANVTDVLQIVLQ